MENYEIEPAKPANSFLSPEAETEKGNEIIESKTYDLSLLNEEYELTMSLGESFIEFKLVEKNNIVSSYYKKTFNLELFNGLLFTFFKEIKKAFSFYDKMLNENKVKLIPSKDKNIISLNLKNIINFEEEVETNLDLNLVKISKDEMYSTLLNEVNNLKKKLSNNKEKANESNDNGNKMKEYIDLIKKEIIEENKKLFEEIISQKNNEIKQLKEIINKLRTEFEDKINEIKIKNELKIREMEKKLNILLGEEEKKEEDSGYLNDNVNLFNNFKSFDINSDKNINLISSINITYTKSVAVYSINRNKSIFYEIAFPDNKNGFNVLIYDILTNKLSNKIINAHLKQIHRIKHYYNSTDKNDLLLTSSEDKSVKIWNLLSNPISNILKISNCFQGGNLSPFCLMFLNGDIFVLGGSYERKKKIWNQNGESLGYLEKSNITYGKYIEATYIDNKPYILLAGKGPSESYDYIESSIKTYKYKNNNENLVINLLKINEKIYLLTGDNGGNVVIFDFISTNEIAKVSVGGYVYSLCTLNEKYILAGNSKNEIKVIDFDSKSIVKEKSFHNSFIYGIEKIKVVDKGEYVITYSKSDVKLWE